MNTYSPIINPNLPQSNIKVAVVSPQFNSYITELNNCGVDVLTTDYCSSVLQPIAYHADTVLSYLGAGNFIVDKSQISLSEKLISLGLKQRCEPVNLSEKYPEDTVLNFCFLSDFVICGKNSILPYLSLDKQLIITAQGYAKCSVCPVDENSLITDDKSIRDACISAGLDVLLVRKGSVRLNGFDYGFIGGCCGKISDDTIAFCGDIKTHDDYSQIISFLRERKVFPISLGIGPLNDIGSIIPIFE